jgi:hypothetical protein
MSEARAARRIVEAALQHAGWPWSQHAHCSGRRWREFRGIMESAK